MIVALILFLVAGCADEKTVSRDPSTISSEKNNYASKSKKQPRRSEPRQVRPIKPPVKKQQPAIRKAKETSQLIKEDATPAREAEKKRRKTIAGKRKERSREEKERHRIRMLFQNGRRVFRSIDKRADDQRLTWKELYRLITETVTNEKFPPEVIKKAGSWVACLEKNSQRLIVLFGLSYSRQAPKSLPSLEFVKQGSVLMTPVQQSMWQHCKLNFENRFPDLESRVVSGYRSPASQAVRLTRMSGNLDDVLKSVAPPNYSAHQRAVPDITVELLHKRKRGSGRNEGAQLAETCRPFGFRVGSARKRSNGSTELGFVGRRELYQSTLSNRIIPSQLKRDFFRAMDRTGFYPSPDGMRVLFAISAQESSLSWNPRLNRPKKLELRRKFNKVLRSIESSFGGKVSELFFSSALIREKNSLIHDLERITDPKNRHIREYDFYLWTLKVRRFLNRLLDENRGLTRLGQWFFKIEQFADQIQYEPQTFGLWQININHLTERIEKHQQLRRRFPEIFFKSGDRWKVVRSGMVDVLSGMPNSVLDRQRTLELIIHTYLQPRYQSHLRGHRDDLMFFAAENVAGEMSTFRAAIQHELNSLLGTRLVLDGDLSFYQPYSTRINWKRPSNTQNAFREFIRIRYAYFKRPVDTQRLLEAVCEADTWRELEDSELYRRIMKKKRGLRVFPNIKSAMYQQTPGTYAKVVLKKSRLF